jgi:NAD(P)-dependent dehydrogenase (short-subunit alcohol dehydrogenase family)
LRGRQTSKLPERLDALTIAGDVADPETAGRIVGAAIERFGRVDTLVNPLRRGLQYQLWPNGNG